MYTLPRHRGFKYGLIFLAWAAAVACPLFIDNPPFEWIFEWRPKVWPYTSLFNFLELPGIALLVSATGVHGSGHAWIDHMVVIFGSASLWLLVTIILIAIWSAIRRRLPRLHRVSKDTH
ncbi:hypothetical protein [Bradyrhizobium sp.]|uniref:hypothetical protein n=1 Tax=Bradyrhizobium sp. TaxID=376 RepID=UPI003C7113C6